ncbi:hypothetical protein PVAP13_2KG100800 [Panicum virgatum]|uniref:Uncharacterized protein n=1 Tax=Panicum virgatum TaxID=38727 RepID=A0A8T0W5H9_PANVG|nr:hypothetical protein PVAP13_2KG100800 [Panicum virgatum]
MLGAVRSIPHTSDRTSVGFVPAFPFLQPRAGRRGWRALDSRHGRTKKVLAVWNPVTDEQRELAALPGFSEIFAAVLCDASAAACVGVVGNLGCSSGPFLVAVIGSLRKDPYICVYSSESDAWSKPASAPYPGYINREVRGIYVQNAVYFAIRSTTRILKYDLGTRGVSVMDPPPMSSDLIALMTAEGGGLGCATENGCRLQMWSREVGSNGLMGWSRRNAFRLRTLKPAGCDILKLHVVGFEDGRGVIYVGTDDQRSFATDLKSGGYLMREVEGVGGSGDILPYMTCYDPGEGPSSAVSSA